LLVLGAYATAVAGVVEVQVKDDYREPTNLWIAVALPPGERKTAVVEHVTKPLEEWEAEQARLLEPVIAQKENERTILEGRLHQAQTTASKSKEATERET